MRTRLVVDPNDAFARVLFVWGCTKHQRTQAAAITAMQTRFGELMAAASPDGRAEAEEIAEAMERAARWNEDVLKEVVASCERLGELPDVTLAAVVDALRETMDASDFDALDQEMGLLAMLDRATATTPDRTLLNELLFRARDTPTDAKAIMLALDAIGGYSEDLHAHALRMNAGEVPESAAWRELALDWFATMGQEIDALGLMADAVGIPAQARAATELRDEMTPDDFERLLRRCGMVIR